MSQTILAIDDSPDIHRLLDVRLRPEGLVVHHALGAEEGFQQAVSVAPDLILLDVDLPHVTGFEVCRRLKEHPVTSNIPVIFLTAAAEVYTKVQGFDLGATDYVTKPFDAAELRARVRAALRTKRYHDMLAVRSNVDALTGLWNRAYFNQRLGEELSASQRYGREVSLVLLDIDRFKLLNDSYGHPFGDHVLQHVGEVLQTVLRTTDAPCRYGGEEFALILSETDEPGAVTTAERVRAALESHPFRPKDKIINVTASFGVVCTTALRQSRLSAAQIITAADDALYAAKQAGRNCVRVGAFSAEERA